MAASVSNTLTKIHIHSDSQNFRLSRVKFSIKVKSIFAANTTNVNPVTMIVSCPIYQMRDINVIAHTQTYTYVISKFNF